MISCPLEDLMPVQMQYERHCLVKHQLCEAIFSNKRVLTFLIFAQGGIYSVNILNLVQHQTNRYCHFVNVLVDYRWSVTNQNVWFSMDFGFSSLWLRPVMCRLFNRRNNVLNGNRFYFAQECLLRFELFQCKLSHDINITMHPERKTWLDSRLWTATRKTYPNI